MGNTRSGEKEELGGGWSSIQRVYGITKNKIAHIRVEMGFAPPGASPDNPKYLVKLTPEQAEMMGNELIKAAKDGPKIGDCADSIMRNPNFRVEKVTFGDDSPRSP